jgi:lipopolysaccharide/colanic/teichoic acid biosynthesis glycosyltransferase
MSLLNHSLFALIGDEIDNKSTDVNGKFNSLKFIHIKETILSNDFNDLQLDLDLPVNSFDQALRIVNLSSSGLLPIPDAVLIDIPFHRAEFVSFIVSLKAMKSCSTIPIIYNAKHLSIELAQSLSRKELVDDVMEIDENFDLLSNKVSFLKKLKNHPHIPCLGEVQVVKEDFSQMYQTEYFKRALDILISTVLIAVSFPILVLIAIAIKLDSGGSVFYSSLRAGCRYKVFKLYKFRTMCMDADLLIDSLNHLNQYDASENSQAKFLKIINDPRITKVGKFLRKTSLDELPQLFNVLKGDMSLVGNRPLPLYEASSLTTNAFVPRFMAPAGITGLWQVTKRGYEKMSANERINLDILYAKKRSFLLDLKIIMLTPLALFQETDS